MPLELDVVGSGMLLDGLIEGRVTVSDEVETLTVGTKRQQAVQYTFGGADVATPLWTTGPFLPPSFLLY